MYNLLVQYMPWKGGTGTVETGRLFEYTDDRLKNQFKDNDSVLFEEMRRFPCLFMQEGTEDELAHVGEITQIRPSGSEILIDYILDPNIDPIPNKVIVANREDFDIRRSFEFSRTHWALKDIDLFRTLLRLSQPLRRDPKVFSIARNETVNRSSASVICRSARRLILSARRCRARQQRLGWFAAGRMKFEKTLQLFRIS